MKSLSDLIAIASDPSTPAERLISLADAPQTEIHRALARNPNTPVDLLQHFWETHPDCILENPVLTLWEFTKPGFAVEVIGNKTLFRLYTHLRRQGGELPAHIFQSKTIAALARVGLMHFDSAVFEFLPFESDPAIRLRMVENPSNLRLFDIYQSYAPDHIWELFSTDPHPDVREQFAILIRSAHTIHAPKRLEILSKAARLLARDERIEIHLHLAHCPYLPADLVEQLSGSADARIREALTGCLFSPLPVRKNLAKDPDENVRLSLTRKSSLPEIHAILLSDPSAKVRKALAENASLSRDILQKFNLWDSPEVVSSLFCNPKTGQAMQLKILNGAVLEVQEAVLRMGRTLTPSFYRKIKPMLHSSVFFRLCEVGGLHRDIFEDLARDPSAEARLGAACRVTNRHNNGSHAKNVAMVNIFASDPDVKIRKQVCTDWRLNKTATALLFSDPDAGVRKKTLCSVLAQLVSNRDKRAYSSYQKIYREKAALIVKLARDPDPAIREAIANCREAPPAALRILLDDPAPNIRKAARNHCRWPYGVMLDLGKNQKSNTESLFHGETTPSSSALRLLAASQNPFVRMLVARCKRTPLAELRKLANDPNPTVREAAEQLLVIK